MLIIGAMLTAILTVGCRAASDQELNENCNPMDEPLIFWISTEVQQEEQPVISELLGEEEEQEQEVLADADIYNRPSMQASQLGKVKEGDFLPVLGICEDNDWYKVVYNGRVAYVRAEAVAMEEADTEEDNNRGQNIQARPASTNQGTAGTRSPGGLPSTTENPSTSHASSETEVSTEEIPSTEASSTIEESATTELSPTSEDTSTTEASPIIDIPPTTEVEQEETQ